VKADIDRHRKCIPSWHRCRSPLLLAAGFQDGASTVAKSERLAAALRGGKLPADSMRCAASGKRI
jgi:hypothetical protein